MKHDAGGIEFSEGNDKAWRLLYDGANQLARLADEDERDSLYMTLQGMNPDGVPNSCLPENTYSRGIKGVISTVSEYLRCQFAGG